MDTIARTTQQLRAALRRFRRRKGLTQGGLRDVMRARQATVSKLESAEKEARSCVSLSMPWRRWTLSLSSGLAARPRPLSSRTCSDGSPPNPCSSERLLNGRVAGRLRRESSGATDFQYDQSWLGWENAIPASVSLPLREDRHIGYPVLAVFENLLPDTEDIRRRLAERSKADGSDAYSLLTALGRDCVGALQFLPDGVAAGQAGAIDGPLSTMRKLQRSSATSRAVRPWRRR